MFYDYSILSSTVDFKRHVFVHLVHVVPCFVLGPSFLLSCCCSFCPYYDKVYCAGADIPEAAPIL